MKNILIATDLTSNSDRALERAFYIAQEHNATLHILHVIPQNNGNEHNNTLEKDASNLIERMITHQKEQAPLLDVRITVIFSTEAIFISILEQSQKVSADLIVMGLHGKTKFKDLFVGTTIERVMRKGNTPVLMVHDKPLCPYQDIISCVDFAPASRSALRLATQLAYTQKATFKAVHIYRKPDHLDKFAYAYTVPHAKKELDTSQEEIMKALLETERHHHESSFGGASLTITGKCIEGSLPGDLIKEAEATKADLITVGVHGQPTFDSSRLGSVAREILTSPPCDVLVVHG
ncbi:MAG: universal stress protein [Bdellovibrionales bacterium]